MLFLHNLYCSFIHNCKFSIFSLLHLFLLIFYKYLISALSLSFECSFLELHCFGDESEFLSQRSLGFLRDFQG